MMVVLNGALGTALARDSVTLIDASAAMAPANVTASSTATAPPPKATNSPAPASGATIRIPWPTDCSAALALARFSPASRSLRRPAPALPSTLKEIP